MQRVLEMLVIPIHFASQVPGDLGQGWKGCTPHPPSKPPNKRAPPTHNTWRPHYPQSQKSLSSIQSWGQPHEYRYRWGWLREREEPRHTQFSFLRPSNPKFGLYPKDGQTWEASQGSTCWEIKLIPWSGGSFENFLEYFLVYKICN